MKYFSVLVLVMVAACLAVTNGQSHHNFLGSVGPYDTLLHKEIVTEKYKFVRVVSKDFIYSAAGLMPPRTISGIKIYDQYTDGTGGTATLTDGGPGFNHVKLHMKSKRNHGFNFIVEIYGR